MAWSTTSEKGPRKDDPNESCLLTDPDWEASEPAGKAEEVDIDDGQRALSLTLKPVSPAAKGNLVL